MNQSTDTPWQKVYDELGIVTPEFDDRPLGAYVEQHASKCPDAIALQYVDRGISYAELNQDANRLANALQAMNIDSSAIIGLHMPNLPNYAVALVAISKLGCAASGVSPLLAPGEWAYQIRDANISVLLSFDALADVLGRSADSMPSCLTQIIQVSADDYLGRPARARAKLAGRSTQDYPELLAQFPPEFAQREVHWSDRFMVQYTGGTTGRPKGAELSVRNLMYNVLQGQVYDPWSDQSEVLASAFPYFHVAGLYMILTGLRAGALNMVIPNPRDVEAFCKQMIAFPPTRIAAVPTLYMMLVNCPLSAEIDFSSLKSAITGAAPLPMEDRGKIEKLLGKGRPSDVFGMTETGPLHVVNPPQRLNPGSVGIPVPGADTRIVDLETGTEEMPPGEAGEIITSGPQVMLGYLNMPEESADALRHWRNKTWMYTGDVGYMDEEGYITLCDRAKDMLIVGGFKVFSVEVEDKLKSLDFVVEAAIIGTADEARPGNDIVNLYVELSPEGRTRDEDSLREQIIGYCREEMAPYKIPKLIHFIDQVPLTAVGKIDKKALRKP